MGVLGMLQQEPGAGEGLLACGADVTGRLILPWKTQKGCGVNEHINISVTCFLGAAQIARFNRFPCRSGICLFAAMALDVIKEKSPL